MTLGLTWMKLPPVSVTEDEVVGSLEYPPALLDFLAERLLRPLAFGDVARGLRDADDLRRTTERIGEMLSETSTALPSLRTREVSKCSIGSPRRVRSMILRTSSRAGPAGR